MGDAKEPTWLKRVRRLQTISQAGISYSSDKYDVEGFREIREIAAEIVEEYSNKPKQKVLTIVNEEKGYVTPKADVRGAVFQNNKILLVREMAGTLPQPRPSRARGKGTSREFSRGAPRGRRPTYRPTMMTS